MKFDFAVEHFDVAFTVPDLETKLGAQVHNLGRGRLQDETARCRRHLHPHRTFSTLSLPGGTQRNFGRPFHRHHRTGKELNLGRA